MNHTNDTRHQLLDTMQAYIDWLWEEGHKEKALAWAKSRDELVLEIKHDEIPLEMCCGTPLRDDKCQVCGSKYDD